MAEACWARASGWVPPTLFRWRVRPQNKIESRFTGASFNVPCHSSIMANTCAEKAHKGGLEGGVFPPSLPSLLKNHGAHYGKKTWVKHD